MTYKLIQFTELLRNFRQSLVDRNLGLLGRDSYRNNCHYIVLLVVSEWEVEFVFVRFGYIGNTGLVFIDFQNSLRMRSRSFYVHGSPVLCSTPVEHTAPPTRISGY